MPDVLPIGVQNVLYRGQSNLRECEDQAQALEKRGTHKSMIHVFTCLGVFLAVDVNSGAVHVLDEAAYGLLRSLCRGSDLDGDCPPGGKEKAWRELRQLRDEGLLFSPHVYGGGMVSQETTPLKALCLHVSHDCNLRCSYCFAGEGDFGTGRALMTPETARRAVEFLIERSGRRRSLEIDFFGGEPLLAFDTVRETVGYARRMAQERGKAFRFTMTTNGIALNGENTDYLAAEMSNVVLSLDGRPGVNDRHRKTAGGQGSYGLVAGKLLALCQARGERGYFVRGTFTPDHLDFTNDVAWLAGIGFKHISVEPAVLPPGHRLAIREEHLPAIFTEYERLARWLLDHPGVSFFHFNLDLTQGPCVYKRLRGCGAGFEYAAVTPEGDVYPCHQFVGQEGYRLGNVHGGDFDLRLAERFSALTVETRTECRSCWAKYYCGGGCAAANWGQNASLEAPYFIGCELERKRVECALAMAAIQSM
jgi:uncharacterized protein